MLVFLVRRIIMCATNIPKLSVSSATMSIGYYTELDYTELSYTLYPDHCYCCKWRDMWTGQIRWQDATVDGTNQSAWLPIERERHGLWLTLLVWGDFWEVSFAVIYATIMVIISVNSYTGLPIDKHLFGYEAQLFNLPENSVMCSLDFCMCLRLVDNRWAAGELQCFIVVAGFHPSCVHCPWLWHRTIVGKSTCGGSEAFPWEAHPRGGNYDVACWFGCRRRPLVRTELSAA